MKLIRYFFVGGIAAVVDIGIFVIFAKVLGFNYLIVAAVGFTLATFVNYFLSVRHVFESGVRFRRAHEIGLVYLVSAIGLAINQTVLYIGIDRLGWEMILTKIVATGVVFVWNYTIRSRFVFKASTPIKDPACKSS